MPETSATTITTSFIALPVTAPTPPRRLP
jgi:hypothetical protein